MQDGGEKVRDTRTPESNPQKPTTDAWQAAMSAASEAAERGDEDIFERWITEAVTEAERLAAEAAPLESPDAWDRVALIWSIAGDVAARRGDHDHAIACFERAANVLASAPSAVDHRGRTRLMALVARSHAESLEATSRLQEARTRFLAYMSGFARIHHEAPSPDALADRVLAAARTGWFLVSIDAMDEVATITRHAFSDIESTLGAEPVPPDAEGPTADLHVLLSRAAPDEEAVEERLLEARRLRARLHERAPSPGTRAGLSAGHAELGCFLEADGRPDEAAIAYERAVECLTDPMTGEVERGHENDAGRAAISAAGAWKAAGHDHRRFTMLERGVHSLIQAFLDDDDSRTLNESFEAASVLIREHVNARDTRPVKALADRVAAATERGRDRRPEDPVRIKLAGFAALLRGQIAEAERRVEDATRHYEHYVACFDTLGTEIDPERWGHDLAMALSSASLMAARFGDPAASDRLYRDAVRCMKSVTDREPSADHLDTLAGIHRDAAAVARERGCFLRARVLERRQIAARERAYRIHPDECETLNRLCHDVRMIADVAKSEGRTDDAAEHHRQVVAWTLDGVKRHPEDIALRWNLAMSSLERASWVQRQPSGESARPLLETYLDALRWIHTRVGTASSARDLLIGIRSLIQYECECGRRQVAAALCVEAECAVNALDANLRHQLDSGLLAEILFQQADMKLGDSFFDEADLDLERAELLARESLRRGESSGRHARLSRILAARIQFASGRADWRRALKWKREEVAIDLAHLSDDTARSTLQSAIELADLAGSDLDASVWRRLLSDRFPSNRGLD